MGARGLLMPNLKLTLLPPPKLMPMLTTDTVDTTAVDTTDTAVHTDTTVARGLPMPPPKLPLLPPLKPKLMPMLTTDTVDTTAVDTDTVDTMDTLTDTDTTEARGPLKPKLHPKLMLTTDTVDTTVVDTDTVDTTAVDTTGVELLLKQTNKPLKLQLSGSSHSKFFQFGYNAKTPSPLIFFET